jgi:hypothetical protein
MKSVVLIPTWRRPEMLWHCLRNIERARGADQYTYLFRIDHGFDPDVIKVAEVFPLDYKLSFTKRSPYHLGKQSYSLITGYQEAAQMTGALVFMIEEDVMVAQDFFEFHEAVHAERLDLFCSIAVANPNRKITQTGPADAYYRSGGDYCSLGVCFRKQMLHLVLSQASSPRYFADPVVYCAQNFKGMPFGHAFAEQDGLIRRIQYQMRHDAPIAWPWQARAYHAGFYGKNRGAGPRGPLNERIANLAEIIYSDEAMRTFAKHPEWYEDSRPINLTAPPWQPLQYLPLLDETASQRF